MPSKTIADLQKASTEAMIPINPTECPFKEFKDNELGADFWGVGPRLSKVAKKMSTVKTTLSARHSWVDEQAQPLPRSVRYHLHNWMRAGELAEELFDADIDVFEDALNVKMSLHETQLSYSYVLTKSSFCRHVLSACYILERLDSLQMEHTWEGFSCALPPEGWRAKNLIYSPGMKPGGGAAHKPMVSENGCYMVRLYYVGAWRCVWVSDQVPVDVSGNPLLPFYPLRTYVQVAPNKPPHLVPAKVVHLWPMLLCKALLKLAAPNMNVDEVEQLFNMDPEEVEDEEMKYFDIFHALTGTMNVWYKYRDPEKTWQQLASQTPVFSWDEDDDAAVSIAKSKAAKKPVKDEVVIKKAATLITLVDTRDVPPWALPGVTPAHSQDLVVIMLRDLPLKKPLPEPEVPLWKTYRWVEWAHRHGLYDDYACPRTRYLKVNGLMKLSFAPHLLDVMSSESLTTIIRREQERLKGAKPIPKAVSVQDAPEKEETREWVKYDTVLGLLDCLHINYFPSQFSFTTATNVPFTRVTLKGPLNRALDIPAPKHAPLYLQVDNSDTNILRISLSVVHPRVMENCGVADELHNIDRAYMLLEVFEWFEDLNLPKPYAYVDSKGYNTVSAALPVGRHFCRVWVHSYLNYQLAILSDSSLAFGSRDYVMVAATKECPWAAKFFNTVSSAFYLWIRYTRKPSYMAAIDREFFASYAPDLYWDTETVGYKKELRHWMFRQALQATLKEKLAGSHYDLVCAQLRYCLMDPDFGLPPRPALKKMDKDLIKVDPEDCMYLIEKVIGVTPALREWTLKRIESLKDVSLSGVSSSISEPREQGDSLSNLDDTILRAIKAEKDRIFKEYHAAKLIQAHWRGVFARKCLSLNTVPSNDVIKLLSDSIFGTHEGMSALMNNFFFMYPGAKTAYSVSSALGGVYGLQQYNGVSPVPPTSNWIGLFQAIFYCHGNVKIHIDVVSSLTPFSKVIIYNNDNGLLIKQVNNAHMTLEIYPNNTGYTVIGNASLKKPVTNVKDVSWQLTILSSLKNMFHPCDNQFPCTPVPLNPMDQLYIQEPFLPNRRKILGGLAINIVQNESISFRATTTCTELDLEAILRTRNSDNEVTELARVYGKGEIYWPCIRIKCHSSPSVDQSSKSEKRGLPESSIRVKPKSGIKLKPSVSKVKSGKDKEIILGQKQFYIEVIASNGWPLTIDQWARVQAIRAEKEEALGGVAPVLKSKKDKEVAPPPSSVKIFPGDAFTVMDCAFGTAGGPTVKRDDTREMQFYTEKLLWASKEPNRNARGTQIREEFLAEYMEKPEPIPEEVESEIEAIESLEADSFLIEVAPTDKHEVSDTSDLKQEDESLVEKRYLTLPECFQNKFLPLPFLDECTKELNCEKPVIITPSIAEAAVQERDVRIDAAIQRRRDLQAYNEKYVLAAQKRRNKLLGKFEKDDEFAPNVVVALEDRDINITKFTTNSFGPKKIIYEPIKPVKDDFECEIEVMIETSPEFTNRIPIITSSHTTNVKISLTKVPPAVALATVALVSLRIQIRVNS